jgi:hypothetical protein
MESSIRYSILKSSLLLYYILSQILPVHSPKVVIY